MLNDPNSVRLVDERDGEQVYIDEVLIPESVETKENVDLDQLEKHWKTTLETSVRTILSPVSENPDIFMMEVIMVKNKYRIYFLIVDLAFATKNRKRLLAVRVIDQKRLD